jgi:hypothetical protein
MARAEQEGIAYLFKLRLTSGVKKVIERLMRGAETTLRLSGWSRARRAVVLRRRIKNDLAVVDESDPQQLRLSFAELSDEVRVYEYAVLVTSLADEILSVTQHYRDRADCEICQPWCLRKVIIRGWWKRHRARCAASWPKAGGLAGVPGGARSRRRRPTPAIGGVQPVRPGGPAPTPSAAS